MMDDAKTNVQATLVKDANGLWSVKHFVVLYQPEPWSLEMFITLMQCVCHLKDPPEGTFVWPRDPRIVVSVVLEN
jgi:hypothetical protein